MTLQRKAIRKAVVCALKGRTFAGAEVYDSDPDDFRPSSGAVATLNVYTLSDVVQTSAGTDTPRLYARDLELAIEVWVEEQTEGQRREDLLDDLTGQVERVLAWTLPRLERVRAAGETLDVNPSKSGLERVEVGFDKQGRALMAQARVVYLVHYGTMDAPFEELPEIRELEGLDVQWDFPPPDGEPEARDEISTTTE